MNKLLELAGKLSIEKDGMFLLTEEERYKIHSFSDAIALRDNKVLDKASITGVAHKYGPDCIVKLGYDFVGIILPGTVRVS